MELQQFAYSNIPLLSELRVALFTHVVAIHLYENAISLCALFAVNYGVIFEERLASLSDSLACDHVIFRGRVFVMYFSLQLFATNGI